MQEGRRERQENHVAWSCPASALLIRLPLALLLPNILRWLPVLGAAYFSSFSFALHIQLTLSLNSLCPRPFPPPALLCLLLRDTTRQPDARGLQDLLHTTRAYVHKTNLRVCGHAFQLFLPQASSSCMPQTLARSPVCRGRKAGDRNTGETRHKHETDLEKTFCLEQACRGI